MAKLEWGTKRTCHNCGARFYDLRREQIVCPVCDTVHDTERQPRTRRGGGQKPSTVTSMTTAKAKSSETVLVDEMASDDVIEDISDDFVEDIDDDSDGDGEDDDDIENLDQENRDLIEDTSDLGEDDDDIGEVIEHIDDDVGDRA